MRTARRGWVAVFVIPAIARAMVYGQRWIDRNGSITVMKGWPALVDTSATPDARGRGQLRARCDTTAARNACQPNDYRTER